MKRYYIYLLSLCTMLSACATNEVATIDELALSGTAKFERIGYNNQMDEIAIAVNKALCVSKEFRFLLKEEAMKQFDGDYDIILRPLSQKTITDVSSTRATDGKTTVCNLLNDYLPSNSKNPNYDAVKAMCIANPLLQIAIPVNIEKWNPATYIPTVVYMGNDYVERETKFLNGYDSMGRSVQVDAVKVPDEPIIVIGLNERGGENGFEEINMVNCAKNIIDKCVVGPNLIMPTNPSIPAPTNFSANLTNARVSLSWTMPNISTIVGIWLYRRHVGVESNFTVIASPTTIPYIDFQLSANSQYEYYVTYYDASYYQSLPSNIILSATTTSQPLSIASFSVNPINNSQIRLCWTQDPENSGAIKKFIGKI